MMVRTDIFEVFNEISPYIAVSVIKHDYTNPPKDVKNVHWTPGGPYFDEFKDVDFAEEWFVLQEETNFCKQK